MKLIDAQQKLLALKVPIIETVDAAACLNVSIMNASKILNRLSKAGIFFKMGKGKWITTKEIDPFILPEYLTSPFPAYVSLQSALYYHGMISQIPAVVYCVSLARSKRHTTPFGIVSVHHLDSDFFFGYETVPNTHIKVATPEKALLDILYFSPTRTQLFKAIPELEIPKQFNIKKMQTWIKKIHSKPRVTIINKRLSAILNKNR